MCEDVQYKVSEYYFCYNVLHPNPKFFVKVIIGFVFEL